VWWTLLDWSRYETLWLGVDVRSGDGDKEYDGVILVDLERKLPVASTLSEFLVVLDVGLEVNVVSLESVSDGDSEPSSEVEVEHDSELVA
jgi:hypothetical protein